MRTTYSDKIADIISPIVGDYVADLALNFQCKSLGIRPEDIGPQHLEELSERISNAVSIQGKADEAEKIKQKIQDLK